MSTALQTISKKLATRFGVDGNNTEVISILKQTAFKQKDGEVSDSQMAALMIVAEQYGLNPFTKEIYAYPDKGGIVPVVGIDGWARIINEHPQMDGIEFAYSEETTSFKNKKAHEWIECIITRKDRTKPIVIREYFEEVCRELQYANPWNTHPKRFHRHKALIQCARVAFGFTGIYDQDEAERIIENSGEKEINPLPEQKKQPEKPALIVLSDDEFNARLNAKWMPEFLIGKERKAFVIAGLFNKYAFTQEQIDTLNNWLPPAQEAKSDNFAELDQ